MSNPDDNSALIALLEQAMPLADAITDAVKRSIVTVRVDRCLKALQPLSPKSLIGQNSASPAPSPGSRPIRSDASTANEKKTTAVPRDQWPDKAKAVALLAEAGERGLGTVLLRLLGSGDGNAEKWMSIMRELRSGCGCVGNGVPYLNSKFRL